MNPFDWFLVVLVCVYALSGYWQGFITGAFATAGLVLGGLLGVWVTPMVLGDAHPSLWVTLGALFIVILTASLGQAVMQWWGGRVRERIRWQPIRAVDALGGAGLSAAAVLLVAWVLGLAITGTRLGAVTPVVRESAVLAKVDELLPSRTDRVLQAFNNVVGTTFFPRYLEPFAPERIVHVEPGEKRMLNDPDVVAARDSVVQIMSPAVCGRGIAGTGFVFAPDRVMTNAHVVAGVTRPEVSIGGSVVVGKVVHFDAGLDVAVVAVETDGQPHLRFDRTVKARDAIAVLGHPGGGPYHVAIGRIRNQQRMRSPDIHQDDMVVREVFSLRADVQPGNSGGPIVTSAGDVAGVVFAASVTDAETGYALTANQVAEAAAKGITSEKPVDTGHCTA